MKLIAECNNISLLSQGNKYYIRDGTQLKQYSKNDAHLIFNDYVARLYYSGESVVNWDLGEEIK